MKKTILFILITTCCLQLNAQQITLRGCTSIIGDQDFVLAITGTVNHNGVTRNTYEALPGQPCGFDASVNCRVRIEWNTNDNEWKIKGGLGTGGSYGLTLYESTTATAPNPPDVDFGGWTAVHPFCLNTPLLTLTGDVQSSFALPVELVDFRAKVFDAKVALSWYTASELNNDRFVVERSLDGVTFEQIGEVIGSGTTLEENNYTFVDRNSEWGVNYYRLKQVDYDGKYEYSNIITATMESKDIVAFPNPTNGWLELRGEELALASVIIYSQVGREMMRFEGNRGDVSQLPSGAYIVKVIRGNEVVSLNLSKI